MPPPGVYDRSSKAFAFGSFVLALAFLYFAREVLIPVALSILLSFLLAPLVARLERFHLPRVLSVIVTVLLAFSLLGLLGWVVSDQLLNIVEKLPEYRTNLGRKLSSIDIPGGGTFDQARQTMVDLQEQLASRAQTLAGQEVQDADAAYPLPVRIVQPGGGSMALVRRLVGPLLAPIGKAGIVCIFVIFLLLYKEDVRDRLIRLIGPQKIRTTTEALDDAGRRVSTFLLMQSIVNGTYGVAIAIGLALTGLPGAVLFGLLCAVLRFIPYVGPWLAAAMPIALSLAVFPTWTGPLIIVGMFVVVELLSNNFMEPWLYGTRTGVSVLPLIVAAVFWTWMWGPIGLVLSTPLTVCLVVLGRYVPQLEFLKILLSDEPPLLEHAHLYQRLLALDQEEAFEIIETFRKDHSLLETCEQLFLPALGMAEQDRHRGELDEPRRSSVMDNLRDAIEDQPTPPASQLRREPPILCMPARDEADELAALMLVQLLLDQRQPAVTLSIQLNLEQRMIEIEKAQPRCLVISALPPFATVYARRLCLQLHERFPDLPLYVGLWSSEADAQQVSRRLQAQCAREVAHSLAGMLAALGAAQPPHNLGAD